VSSERSGVERRGAAWSGVERRGVERSAFNTLFFILDNLILHFILI
jgi:hypothetical protein